MHDKQVEAICNLLSKVVDGLKNIQLNGDIEIGAVEIKDAATDTRAAVSASLGLQVNANGDVADGAAQVNLKPVYAGGRAEDLGSLPGSFAVGQAVGLRFNRSNGALIVTNGNLDPSVDTVTNILKPDGTSTYCPNYNNSGLLENSHISKGSAGVYYGIRGYNSGPAQFILVFNSATVPADGAVVPIDIIKVPSGSNFSSNGGSYGEFCSNGVSWCNSINASPFTKAIGAADCFVKVQNK